MNEQLMSDLASADPVDSGDDAKLHGLVGRMAIAARDAAMNETPALTPWWKRRRIIVPLGVASVAVLSGGALLIPLSLSVNGTKVEPDAQIPIVYTTDTGVDVSCRYEIYIGEPGSRDADDLQLADFMDNHDWAGIGQRIYEYAIANPFAPGPDGGMETDTPQGRDELSLARATSRLIEAEIPESLQGALLKEGTVYSSTTDCKGVLH